MKITKVTQIAPCFGRDIKDSVRIYNEEMIRLADCNPKTSEKEGGFLIYYTVTKQVPEGVAEERRMQGIYHKCIECNHCERPLNRFGQPDERKKKIICNKTGAMIHLTTDVCDIFYEEMQDVQEFKESNAIEHTRRFEVIRA